MILTDQQIAEIEERCNAASQAPWLIDIDRFPGHLTVPESHVVVYVDDQGVHCDVDIDKANQEFIAHSREDLPALLHTVKVLKRALESECNQRLNEVTGGNHGDAELQEAYDAVIKLAEEELK
jgi:hypothetical protein